MPRPTRLATKLAGALFKAIKKYAWRQAALRPVLLLMLAVIVIGLLLARTLITQPQQSTFPMPSVNQTAQLDLGSEAVLQSAHDAQPAGQTVGLATAELEDRDSEQSVKQQVQAEVGPMRGNLQSKVFHLPGCRNYECKSCTQIFQSREEALAAGYRPCKQCAQ